MTLADVVKQLDEIAPPHLAEAWDNVGLLVGDPAADVSRAILCIDYTAAVAAEASAAGCDLVLAYHPLVFKPLNRLTADGPAALVFDAIRRGVAVYSPHTALDVVVDGTNDVLVDVLGLVDCRPLRPTEAKTRTCKLVTFVPPDHIDAVAEALFAAGAGRIGDYSNCSLRSEGHGTFLGGPGTTPAVGQAGRLETAREVRVETVLPLANVASAVAALKQSHPYETPAFDLVALAAPPTGTGIGRFGRLKMRTPREAIFATLKAGLGIDHLLVAGPRGGDVSTCAVCAGAGGEFLDDALATGADLYIAGELRHHDALRAAAAGMTVVCTLHSHSERVTLRRLVLILAARMPGVVWQVSQADDDPFRVA